MKLRALILCMVMVALALAGPAGAADQRLQYTEEMVGAGHPTKSDTLNRLPLVEHENDGKHTKATMPELASDPSTDADEGVVYVKEAGGASELHYRGESDGTVVQITNGGKLNAAAYGLISGLLPVYVSGTALGFGGGTLDIAGTLYRLTAGFSNLDCSGLSASTWYFVEVTAPGSGFALSVSNFSLTTSAPSFSDSLGYLDRSGKRCVFVFKTDGSGNVLPFLCNGISYWLTGTAAILSSGSPATTDTTLSIGLPSLGALKWYGMAYLSQSNAQEYKVYMTPAAATGGDYHLIGDAINSPGSYVFPFTMYSDSSQQDTYKTVWNGAGSLAIYLLGFDLPAGMAR